MWLWSVSLSCFWLLSLVACENVFLENIDKIISWQKERSATSSQFALGVSIGIALLRTHYKAPLQYSDPVAERILIDLMKIEDDFQSSGNAGEVELKFINSTFWLNLTPLSAVPVKYLFPPPPASASLKSEVMEHSPPFTSLKEYLDVVDSGHPTEAESDYCLQSIFLSPCDRSGPFCRLIMTASNSSFGYHATHKILYWLIVKQNNCLYSLTDPVRQCRLIYQEFIFLYSILPENPQFIDLFMEQQLLCGLLGFQQFLSPIYVNFVSQWLKSVSCSDNSLCNDHSLGVAIALQSLSLILFE